MNDKLDERLQRLANSTNRTLIATIVPGEHTTSTSVRWPSLSHQANEGKGVPVTGSQASAPDATIKTYTPGGGTTGSGAGTAYNAAIGPPATGSVPPTRGSDQAASGPYMTSARGPMPAQQNP